MRLARHGLPGARWSTVVEPGLYPRTGPRPGAPSGERALWRALSERLPAGWFAWHSMRLRTRRGVEGEGDFVIGIPKRGALVIEVKSGAIEVAGGVWYQNGRAMDRAPREQAHEFRRTLKDALADRGVRDCWIDLATAFPDTPFVNPPSQSDLRDAVLGQRDLEYLGEALVALADNLFIAPNGQRAYPPRSDRWIEVLHELWGASWVKASRLGDRDSLRSVELVQLDSHQQEILDALVDNPRLVVRGGPGTGKTLLAMEAARRHAAERRRAKIVCFTRALGAELRAEGFDASTVRELAADLLCAAGKPPASSAREEWDAPVWEAVTPQAMGLVAPGGLDSCDAMIVDEAQDFTHDDWKFVRALAAKRPLWVFIDEGQAYWPDRLHLDAAAEGFASYRMMEAYRTPHGLDRFAAQYRAGHTAPPLPAPIEGLRIVPVADESAIEAAVVRELAAAREGGLALARQVVLSLAGQTRTHLATLDKLGGVPVRRADAADAGEYVVVDTFLRFKGLERPLVIVTELSLAKTAYDVRMHIALTRATVECVVVATEAEIRADSRLGAARM